MKKRSAIRTTKTTVVESHLHSLEMGYSLAITHVKKHTSINPSASSSAEYKRGFSDAMQLIKNELEKLK